jgi:hypothetical protein
MREERSCRSSENALDPQETKAEVCPWLETPKRSPIEMRAERGWLISEDLLGQIEGKVEDYWSVEN